MEGAARSFVLQAHAMPAGNVLKSIAAALDPVFLTISAGVQPQHSTRSWSAWQYAAVAFTALGVGVGVASGVGAVPRCDAAAVAGLRGRSCRTAQLRQHHQHYKRRHHIQPDRYLYLRQPIAGDWPNTVIAPYQLLSTLKFSKRQKVSGKTISTLDFVIPADARGFSFHVWQTARGSAIGPLVLTLCGPAGQQIPDLDGPQFLRYEPRLDLPTAGLGIGYCAVSAPVDAI